jgi:hypothetical protein
MICTMGHLELGYVSHNTPSAICCIPNKNGILAKGISFIVLLAFLIAATPITVSTTPAPILALAEKYILQKFRCRR